MHLGLTIVKNVFTHVCCCEERLHPCLLLGRKIAPHVHCCEARLFSMLTCQLVPNVNYCQERWSPMHTVAKSVCSPCSLFGCAHAPFLKCCSECLLIMLVVADPLVGLVVKASTSRTEDSRFESACAGIFRGRVILCQAPGAIGSALGLVGPVSIYCDWVR